MRGGADLSSESHIVNGSVKDASLMLETPPDLQTPPQPATLPHCSNRCLEREQLIHTHIPANSRLGK